MINQTLDILRQNSYFIIQSYINAKKKFEFIINN